MIAITQDVINHVSEGFSIPSMPSILIEIQEICADPNGDLTDLARVISTDIGLSSAILKTTDNLVSSLKRRQNIEGWDDVKESCYVQLGINEDIYQDLSEDLEALWQERE